MIMLTIDRLTRSHGQFKNLNLLLSIFTNKSDFFWPGFQIKFGTKMHELREKALHEEQSIFQKFKKLRN